MNTPTFSNKRLLFLEHHFVLRRPYGTYYPLAYVSVIKLSMYQEC